MRCAAIVAVVVSAYGVAPAQGLPRPAFRGAPADWRTFEPQLPERQAHDTGNLDATVTWAQSSGEFLKATGDMGVSS